MKKQTLFILFVIGVLALRTIPAETLAASDSVDSLIAAKGKLLFEDKFERAEKDDSKEQLGGKWTTNSKRRAKGAKQGDLKDGYLAMTIGPEADHAISIKHDAPFDDGVVRVRFRMHDKKGIGFNFNDPKCKVSHAGHICHVGVKPGKVDFRDGKTGVFDKKIRERRLAGAPKQEIAKLTKGKFAYRDSDSKIAVWHEMTIVIQADLMTAYMDEKKVGQLRSEGIDHKVKQNLAFSVPGRADVDDLRVWSLD